jgi:hypothetical protein
VVLSAAEGMRPTAPISFSDLVIGVFTIAASLD